MIKLNDTVSFVDVNGQAHTGTVDAFRGQGMADLTLTDGVQVRQPVSSLSPVRSNPRVSLRSNPRPVARVNARFRAKTNPNLPHEDLIRNTANRLNEPSSFIPQLFNTAPLTTSSAEKLTNFISRVIGTIRQAFFDSQIKKLHEELYALPPLATSPVQKTEDGIQAAEKKVDEINQKLSSLAPLLKNIPQNMRDEANTLFGLKSRLRNIERDDVAGSQAEREQLANDIAATRNFLRQEEARFAQKKDYPRLAKNVTVAQLLEERNNLKRELEELEQTIRNARNYLLSVPQWQRFVSEKDYQIRHNQVEKEASELALEMSLAYGQHIKDRMNKKAIVSQDVITLTEEQLASKPMAREVADALFHLGGNQQVVDEVFAERKSGKSSSGRFVTFQQVKTPLRTIIGRVFGYLLNDGLTRFKSNIVEQEVNANTAMQRLLRQKADLELKIQNFPSSAKAGKPFAEVKKDRDALEQQLRALVAEIQYLRDTLLDKTLISAVDPRVQKYLQDVADAQKVWTAALPRFVAPDPDKGKKTEEEEEEEERQKELARRQEEQESPAKMLLAVYEDTPALVDASFPLVITAPMSGVKAPGATATLDRIRYSAKLPAMVGGPSDPAEKLVDAVKKLLITNDDFNPTEAVVFEQIDKTSDYRKKPAAKQSAVVFDQIDKTSDYRKKSADKKSDEKTEDAFRTEWHQIQRQAKALYKDFLSYGKPFFSTQYAISRSKEAVEFMLRLQDRMLEDAVSKTLDVSNANYFRLLQHAYDVMRKEYFASLGLPFPPSEAGIQAAYAVLSDRRREADREKEKAKNLTLRLVGEKEKQARRMEPKKLAEQKSETDRQEGVGKRQLLADVREQSQGVPIGNLSNERNKAAYAIVPDPVRYSPLKEVVCGNVIDGNAFLMAISKEARSIKHFITWRDLGIKTPAQLADIRASDPAFLINQDKVPVGTERARSFQPVDLTYLLTDKTLNTPQARIFNRIKVENLAQESVDLIKYSLRRPDRDSNTTSNLVLLEPLDLPDKIETQLQTSLAGKTTTGQPSMNSKFVVVKDYSRRVGKGRTALDYSLPSVARCFQNVYQGDGSSERRAKWHPDDPVLFADDNGDAFGFLLSGKISTSHDLLRKPFNLFDLYSDKDRNPYYSWVREKRSMLTEDPVCIDNTTLAEFTAIRETTNTLRKYLRALTLLELGFMKYDGAGTWDQDDLTTSDLGQCLMGAMSAVSNPHLDRAKAIKEVFDVDLQQEVIVYAALAIKEKELKDQIRQLNFEVDEAIATIRQIENTWYTEAQRRGEKPAQADVLNAVREHESIRDKGIQNLKEMEAQLVGTQELIYEINAQSEQRQNVLYFLRSLEKDLTNIQESIVIAERQRRDLIDLWPSLVNAMRGAVFSKDRIDESRFVSAYRGRQEADYAIFQPDNMPKLAAIFRNGASRIPSLKSLRDPVELDQAVNEEAQLISTSALYLNKIAVDALSHNCVVYTTVSKGKGNFKKEYGSYDAAPQFAIKTAKEDLEKLSRSRKIKELQSKNPTALMARILVMTYEGKEFSAVLKALVELAYASNQDKLEQVKNRLVALELAQFEYRNVYATSDTAELFFKLAALGGTEAQTIARAKALCRKNTANPDDPEYQHLLEAVTLSQKRRKQKVAFPSADRIIEALRNETKEALAAINVKYMSQDLAPKEIRDIGNRFEALTDLVQFLTERACTMVQNVRFFTTSFNKEAALFLYLYYDSLRHPKITGNLSDRYLREETLEQPRGWILTKSGGMSQNDFNAKYRDFGLSLILPITKNVRVEAAPSPLGQGTLRLEAASVQKTPLAQRSPTQKQASEDRNRRRAMQREQGAAAEYYIMLFRSMDNAQQVKERIESALSPMVFSSIEALKEKVNEIAKTKDQNDKPVYDVPPLSGWGGAKVRTEEEQTPYMKKLDLTLRDLQLAVKGVPATAKVVTPQRGEGAREKGFDVYYTYNPLLFQLTRLFYPGTRTDPAKAPWKGWYSLSAYRDPKTDQVKEKAVLNYPDLADRVDAIGLYGSLLLLLRQGALAFERTNTYSPSSLEEIIQGIQDYFETAEVPRTWYDYQPEMKMSLDLGDWDKVYTDRLVESEASLTQLMRDVKKAAIIGLTEAARLADEGLNLPSHTGGLGGKQFRDLEKMGSREEKGPKGIKLNETTQEGQRLSKAIERITPILQTRAGQPRTLRYQDRLLPPSVDPATVGFWNRLANVGIPVIGDSKGIKGAEQRLTAGTRADLYTSLVDVFSPLKGNLLSLLGAVYEGDKSSAAQAQKVPQNFNLAEVEDEIVQQKVLPDAVRPWLARRLSDLISETGRVRYIESAEPLRKISAGAGQELPEPTDSWFSRAQKIQSLRNDLLQAIDKELDQTSPKR